MKIKMLIAALAISGMTSAQTLKSGIDKANMNLEVKPGEDFTSLLPAAGSRAIHSTPYTP